MLTVPPDKLLVLSDGPPEPQQRLRIPPFVRHPKICCQCPAYSPAPKAMHPLEMGPESEANRPGPTHLFPAKTCDGQSFLKATVPPCQAAKSRTLHEFRNATK